jgi:TonB family protein
MHRVFFVFLLVFLLSHLLRAQSSYRFYYNKNWVLTRQDSAFYLRICDFDTLLSAFDGTVKDFTNSGKLVMEGKYVHGVKNGAFAFYYPNGQIESTGVFSNNNRDGVWKYFYENGVAKQEIRFADNYPRVLFYNDSSGTKLLENGNGKWKIEYEQFLFPHKIIVEGQFKDGERTGVWVCRLSNGEYFYKERYNKGQFKSGYFTRPNGSIKQEYFVEFENKFLPPYKLEPMEKFKYVKGLIRADYPFLKFLKPGKGINQPQLSGSDNKVYNFVEKQPEFPGGWEAMMRFFAKNLRYPVQSKRRGVEGKVFVSFTIEKDGSISDARVEKGISEDCDVEAVRLVNSFPKWIPGTQNDNLVRVKFVLPISFKLGR